MEGLLASLVDEGALACTAQASSHQGDELLFPLSRNASCVAISACGVVLGLFKAGEHGVMTGDDLDAILLEGYKIYLGIQNTAVDGFLEPSDLPRLLKIRGRLFMVSEICGSRGGSYPLIEADIPDSLARLVQNLLGAFEEAPDNQSGFFFTGQTYTVTFWEVTGGYFCFNSHGVNTFGQHDLQHDHLNKSRLFFCSTLDALATLLFSNAALDGVQRYYSIDRIRLYGGGGGSDDDEDQDVDLVSDSSIHLVSSDDDSGATAGMLSDCSVGSIISGPDDEPDPFAQSHTYHVPAASSNHVPPHTPPVSSSDDDKPLSSRVPTKRPAPSSDDDIPLSERRRTPVARVSSDDDVPLSQRLGTPVRQNSSDDDVPLLSRVPTKLPVPTSRRKRKAQVEPTQRPLTRARFRLLSQHSSRNDVSDDDAQSISSVVSTSTNASSTCSSRGLGRPRKAKRGRPKKMTKAEREKARKESQRKYREANRAKVMEPIRRYDVAHPEVHRGSVSRHTAANPTVSQASSARHRAAHPENDAMRHLEPALRQAEDPLGWLRPDELDRVKLYKLKQPSLLSPDVSRCPHCKAPLFEEEKKKDKWCCGGGLYNVMGLRELDAPFYAGQPPFRDFWRRPGQYNNTYAMAAMRLEGRWAHPRSGITFVKIQGRVYHQVYDQAYRGSHFNNSLWFDDNEERLRLANGEGLNTDVANAIDEYLHDVNPYVPWFRRLSDESHEHAHLVFQTCSRRVHGNSVLERAPDAEVCALSCTEQEPYSPRQVVIWRVGRASAHKLKPFSELLEPFCYPLLFPHGEQGWSPSFRDQKGNKMGLLKYLRCLLLSEPRFSQFGRLSETYLIDMYCRWEEGRMEYFLKSQEKAADGGGLRGAPASELRAVVESRAEAAAVAGPSDGPGSGSGRGRGRGRGRGAGRRRGVGRGSQSGAGGRPLLAADVLNDETIAGEGSLDAGRRYLPSTHVGSPRYMQKKYRDSLAICSRLGGPHFFLTVAANGSWTESRSSFHKSSSSEAQVVARVFKLKMDELLRDLRSGAFFGQPAFIVWTCETQARGLPHFHILFRVKDHQPLQASDVDRIVRADLPKPEEAGGRLLELVKKHMLHSKHSAGQGLNLPCWDSTLSKCSKHYPKPPTPVTHCDDRGFYLYRRDPDNKSLIYRNGRQIEVSDCDVVPYNAAMLLKYDCHINLEVATRRRVILYLYKYINKSTPVSRVGLVPGDEQGPVNECEDYITRRYLGSGDVAWRVLGYHLTGRQPNVEMLPVHLENEQFCTFHPGEELSALEKSESNRLAIYFNRPKEALFDNITYQDFYENYILHTSRPKTTRVPVWAFQSGGRPRWVTPRQHGECITRLFWVAPNRGELYYLRVLLSKFPARGYKDLKALGGPTAITFQEAARALGLVDDEREFFNVMDEALTFMMPRRLRSFFITLCNNGAPAALLWDQYREQLSADFREHMDDERAFTRALIHIDRGLRRNGLCNVQQGLPAVQDDTNELGRELLAYSNEELTNYLSEWLPRLTREQRRVYDYVMTVTGGEPNVLTYGCPSAMFLNAFGGSGKTQLCRVICAQLRLRQKVVLCAASSGIAALNLEGGLTAHSLFKLPLEVSADGNWSITNGSQRAELIRRASLVIFDEVPMIHKFHVEMIERSLRDLLHNDEPFGGKCVLFCGDFRQLAPIVRSATTPRDVFNASLRSSRLWPTFKKFQLTSMQRARGHQRFADAVLAIGDGTAAERVLEGETLPVVPLPMAAHTCDKNHLVNSVFPEDILSDPDECAKRAILSTHLVNVRHFNQDIMDRLPAEEHSLYSVDSVDDEDMAASGDFHDPDLLHEATASGVPDHCLKLKVGAVCMVTRNLNLSERLVNGSKVIIVAIRPYAVIVRRPGENEHFIIPRIVFKFPIARNSPLVVRRRQFPLALAYALSIHKSQGQTIQFVGVDLRSDPFTHGMLYVALSRVRSPNDLLVLVRPERVFNGVAHAPNIVYKDLLV